ncbi:CDGSH iron-sulfur domain-containing protein [Dendronalium sp. ChiSLP03b]|uniref:CDGSH iron-sulfur domain-containing protein n=1 Tax=Dendronalium sp. ChiSLP03b TaxID=3075381 RepID=UPI00391DB703
MTTLSLPGFELNRTVLGDIPPVSLKIDKSAKPQTEKLIMSNEIEEYRGESITIFIHGNRCIHSRNCVLGHPDVFVPNAEGDWIHPDKASSETIAAIAQSCPSGAIAYERLDGGEPESAPEVNIVRIRENGPLAFHAELDIAGDTSSFRATLCRCGASSNKPFCDSSHNKANFQATGEPLSHDSQPLSLRNGLLKIAPSPNGPLLVQGPLEVCTGTGRTVTRTTQTALCRCGASNNKPFCDGSHAKVGFKDA